MPVQSRQSLGTFAIATATTLVSISLISYYTSTRRGKVAASNQPAADGKDSLPYPPSPPTRHWLFGHALHLQPKPDQPKVSHDVRFLDWMQKLNSKVIMFELPVIRRMIVVADPDVARYVLVTGKFNKSPTYSSVLPLVGRKSLVVTEGKEWASQRRLYNPGFSPEFLRNVVGTILQKCNRFLANCDGDIDNASATDMLARAIDLTSDVIAQVGFGEDWGVYDPLNGGTQTLKTIRELTVVIGEQMVNPLLRYFSLRSKWKSWRLSSTLDRDMQRLVKRRLEKLRASPQDGDVSQKDILSLTLSSVLRSKENLGGMDDISFSSDDMEDMTSQLKTFYFAGHDTTAVNIAWAFWLLVQHPQRLERAREEVVTHLGRDWAESASLGNELDTTTYEKLQKCEYLDAVTREALRLYPPAATARYAVDPDASAGGYLLGKSVISLNFYAMQRDPDIWEDGDSFVPERFLGEDGKKRVASFSFLPFSKGSRDCIGKYFALLEAKIALAALVCRYDATVVDVDEVYTNRLTSIPKDGCKVNLRRRRA